MKDGVCKRATRPQRVIDRASSPVVADGMPLRQHVVLLLTVAVAVVRAFDRDASNRVFRIHDVFAHVHRVDRHQCHYVGVIAVVEALDSDRITPRPGRRGEFMRRSKITCGHLEIIVEEIIMLLGCARHLIVVVIDLPELDPILRCAGRRAELNQHMHPDLRRDDRRH